MLISISDLNKSFGENHILNNANMTIEDNTRYGLIGVNGAGKSTLLEILIGKLEYDAGEVYKASSLNIGYLKQNSGLDRNSTIIVEMRRVFSSLLKLEDDMRALELKMQNITEKTSFEYKALMSEYSKKQAYFEARDGYNVDVKIKTILNGMGFADKDLNTEIQTLSGGEKTRLAIASLLLEEPNLLILDEPTNHLDFKTLEWLENYLVNDYKGSLLIVSHDRYFLDSTVDNIIEIENGQLNLYKGNYTKYIDLKAERKSLQQKEYDEQQVQISKLQTYVDKNIVRASTSSSAKSRVKALENMELIEKPDSDIKPIKLKFDIVNEPYKDVLTVTDTDVTVGTGTSRQTLCKHLNLSVKRGEKIALIGDNGVGKSSFLKTIQGIIPHEHGKIIWGKNTSISYYEQENLNLHPNKLAIDELWDRFPRINESQIRRILGNVRLTRDEVYKPINVLSGGERAKIAFCIIMLEKSNVILFDEPTNHLDLPSKEVLEKAMSDYEGTLIFVSHDRYLLNKVPTKLVEMTNDGFTVFDGNFDYYKKRKEWLKKNEVKSEEIPDVKPKSSGATRSAYRSKEQRRADAMRKNRISELERLIAESENRISELETDLTHEDVFSDYELLTEKTSELEELNEKLLEFYNEWETLSEEA